jgi:hypothetical protein
MKLKIATALITTMVLSTVISASQSAEELYDAKCSACHSKTRPTNMSEMVAPPVFGVMRHVKMRYPNKKEAVNFMVDYVLNPTIEKAICMPAKIKRFGLMPSQKGNVTKDELIKISNWMFDNFGGMNKNCNNQSCGAKKSSCGAKKQANSTKPKPFLITGKLPHLTMLVKYKWNDKNLNLTKEQKMKLLKVRKKTISGVKAIFPKINNLENEIVILSMSGEKVENIYPKVKKVAELKSNATKLHLECIYDTKNILTPMQLQYLLK